MRRSPLGRCAWLVAALAACAPLVLGGCTLVQPGCRNRDVKAAIEREARDSMELWMSASNLGAPGETTIALADQVEVDRHDNARSCSGNVVVGIGKDSVPVPIEYVVTAGDDGQAFYQWDNTEFGKKALATAVMSALAQAAQPRHEASVPAASPPAPMTSPPSAMEAWKNDVYATIVARAEKLTDMPRGKQRMRFRIGPDGEIRTAMAVEPIGNADLANKLVKFLDESDVVTKPPSRKVTWAEVVFNFQP